MDLYEVINKRRTSREWTDKEIDFEATKRIIEAGMKAPSWDHYRNWQSIVLENGDRLLFHLQMTGCLLPTTADWPEEKHTHVIFQLNYGKDLRLSDTRRFGRFWLLQKDEPATYSGLEKLGKEPDALPLNHGVLYHSTRVEKPVFMRLYKGKMRVGRFFYSSPQNGVLLRNRKKKTGKKNHFSPAFRSNLVCQPLNSLCSQYFLIGSCLFRNPLFYLSFMG